MDLLLHRYSNIDFIMDLDLETGIRLMNKAMEEERDEKLFRQWCAQLPYMGKETYMSFEQYRDRLLGLGVDKRPTEEILAELDEVEKEFTRMEDDPHGDGDF